MPELSHVLSVARKAARLSVETMAALADCTPEEWQRCEADIRKAGTPLLDRAARVFGLRLQDLLSGEAEQSPAVLLLRSMGEHGTCLDDYLALEAHRTLGEFLRCVRDLAELEALTQKTPTWRWLEDLAPLPIVAESEAPHGALDLALRVRDYLGLGTAPIPSMVELLRERLHIALFFVEPDALDRNIDGASTLNPRPAILVNLVSGAGSWWRTRMTLAHELCHLLFDRTVLDQRTRRFFLFSPYDLTHANQPARRLTLVDHFASLERRAGAFAAYLLAPPEGVREVVGDLYPGSEEAIRRVCSGYMVGRVTAINLLTNIYKLSRQERMEMEGRWRGDMLPAHHPDISVPGVSLRDGGFRDRVMEAFAAEQIDEVEARGFLGLRLSEPLPLRPGLDPSRCRPLRAEATNIRAQAERFLAERAPAPGYFVGDVARREHGWEVTVYRRLRGGEDVYTGVLILDLALHVREPVSWLAAPAPSGP